MGDKQCRKCGTTENLQKNRTICKGCHAEANRIWWNNLSEEDRKARGSKYYKSGKKKSKEDFDFLIRTWFLRWKNRSGYPDRKMLNIDDLIQIGKLGLDKYPYMDFSRDRKSSRAFWPSVDRIDPEKDYSDITNLECIPLWLNSAKLDITHVQLKELMLDYLSKTE